MKVLVAEDDLTSRILLVSVLRKWGFEPVVAEDGEEALALLEGPGAARLVLLDWSMPRVDGVEACRRLREREDPDDPPYVVLLTGRSEKESIVEGLEAGANDYVTKPYDNEELRARLRVGERMLALQEALNGAKAALIHQARHDGLTGILNRRAVLEELERLPPGAGVVVALCDLDRFKEVNDRHGHLVGDDVLRAFASRIGERLEKGDLFGRYGGEEFLLGFPSLGENRPFLEGLVRDLSSRGLPTRSGEVRVTMSVGAVWGRGGGRLDLLLARADEALYRAKREGRDRVVFAPSPEGEAT